MAIWQYFFPSHYSKWSSRKREHCTNLPSQNKAVITGYNVYYTKLYGLSQIKLILTLKPYTLDNKISALKKTLHWVSEKDKPVFKQIHIQCFYNLSRLNLQITLSQLLALIQSFLLHCILLLDIWTINTVFVTPSSEITICQTTLEYAATFWNIRDPFYFRIKLNKCLTWKIIYFTHKGNKANMVKVLSWQNMLMQEN